jgi:hypothetical protein
VPLLCKEVCPALATEAIDSSGPSPFIFGTNPTEPEFNISSITPASWLGGFRMAKTTGSAHSCSMRTEEVVKFAAEEASQEEETLKKRMEEKSCETTDKDGELYAKV